MATSSYEFCVYTLAGLSFFAVFWAVFKSILKRTMPFRRSLLFLPAHGPLLGVSCLFAGGSFLAMGFGRYDGNLDIYLVGITILCWSLIGIASSIFWWTRKTLEIFDAESRVAEEAARRKQSHVVHKEKINLAFKSLSDYLEIYESDVS
jgi:hypothetical protein